MDGGNAIRVRIQRGTAQIGGVCTEVFTDRTRIFFDFGTPLKGEGNQDKLSIEGLTYGTINTDAVFLTHYHGDHVGEVPDIMPGIPVYMHKTARRILQAQQEHKKCLGQVVWANRISELTAAIELCPRAPRPVVSHILLTPKFHSFYSFTFKDNGFIIFFILETSGILYE